MDNLYEYLVKEYNAHFSGWDFSYVEGKRMELSELPWDYQKVVESNLPGKSCLLDMNTGGGEFLCSLKNLPENVYATEAYEPNIPIAEKKLKEKSFVLKPVKNGREIPFDNDFFDMIINRHWFFEVKEVKRALRKDGIFITQQVGGLNGIDINMAFGTEPMDEMEWCLIQNIERFKDAEMEIIDFGEDFGKMRFNDIGAFVYYLKCIKWQVKDFSIEKYYKKLERINEIIERNGYIDFITHRFYFFVKKL